MASTAVPLIKVVEVTEYVPGHVPFGTRNGNEMVFDVPFGMVNAGVVNISVCVLLQESEVCGPVNSNFTLMVCELFVQDITFEVTVTLFPLLTVDGLIPIAT